MLLCHSSPKNKGSMNTKNFTQMSAEERKAWLADYQNWYAEHLPVIEKAGNITSGIREQIEKGLNLMAAFPFCRAFVNEALRFKDYASRKKLIRRYADKITADLKTSVPAVDLTDPALLASHVGRPTKEEAAARAIAAEKERQEREAAEDTLFGKKADIPTIDAAAPETVAGSMGGGTMLHLDQLKWLMSPDLANAIETIRDLRTRQEDADATAKALALAGKPEQEVAPYAEEAIRLTKQVEGIYERVDNEMATVYVRLKEDTAFRASIEAQKVEVKALRSTLRPYWDKVENQEVFKAKVIEMIKESDPVQKEAREKAEAKKKAVDDIVKYLQRKDKDNTPKRIETMTARYQELVELIGEEDAKTYLPILEAAKEDCEKNIKPKLDAERAAREAKKAEKKAAKKAEKKAASKKA